MTRRRERGLRMRPAPCGMSFRGLSPESKAAGASSLDPGNTCRDDGSCSTRLRLQATLLASSLLALWLAACGDSPVPAKKTHLDDCRRIVVEDPSGAPIVGIEDIAIDHARALAYLSAYDRRAVDAELAAEAGPKTVGGLYVLDLARAFGDRVRAERLLGPDGLSPVRRPHGIALDRAGGRLAAIDRRYAREQGGWRLDPGLVELTLSPDPRSAAAVRRRSFPGWLCAPNDLAYAGEDLLVTSDHGRCRGAGRLAEDVLGLTGAVVARLTPHGWARAVTDVPFANGVAYDAGAPAGLRLAVAASRAGGLFFFPAEAREHTAGQASRFLDLGAAPDNITRGADGALYVAAHPSLLAFALYRAGWPGFARAPSAAYRVTLEGDKPEAEQIFHDPAGRVIAAATVAARYRDTLLLGAVFDAGLGVCELALAVGEQS